jgi:hypothetical protein
LDWGSSGQTPILISRRATWTEEGEKLSHDAMENLRKHFTNTVAIPPGQWLPKKVKDEYYSEEQKLK